MSKSIYQPNAGPRLYRSDKIGCEHSAALVLGRALHQPWNEGTRVIGRDTAHMMKSLRPVQVVSLTQEQFRHMNDEALDVHHVYTHMAQNVLGDNLALSMLMREVHQLIHVVPTGVAHFIGAPLGLAPFLHHEGIRVVQHVLLVEQAYQNAVERLRGMLGWRLHRHWIDAYACAAAPVRDVLLQRGLPPEKVHVVPPATDTRLFSRTSRSEARARLGWSPESFMVVYIGTVSPLRFPGKLIMRALNLARQTIPELELAIFAPLMTHAYNQEWVESNVLRSAMGTQVPIDLRLVDMSEEEKRLVYSAADVMLFPFMAPVAVEPPLTLLEAMACGSIVAAAPYANKSAIVTHAQNGWLFNNQQSLVQAVQHTAEMPNPQRKAMGQAARATIIDGYSRTAAERAIQQLWNTIEQ